MKILLELDYETALNISAELGINVQRIKRMQAESRNPEVWQEHLDAARRAKDAFSAAYAASRPAGAANRGAE